MQFLDLLLQAQVTLIPLDIQLPCLHRPPDRAPGILPVLAIREPALPPEFLHVRETFPEGLLVGPHLDLPHSGIVDQDPTAGQHHQFPRRGRMPALAGHGVHLTRPLPLLA